MQVLITAAVGMLIVFSIYWQLKCLKNDFAALAPSFLFPNKGLEEALETGQIIKDSKFISAIFFVGVAHLIAPIAASFALFEAKEDKQERSIKHDLDRYSFSFCERRKWVRIWFPSLIVLFLVTGVLVNGFFEWFDQSSKYNFYSFLSALVASFLFILLFSIKNMFAPIITTFSFSYTVFQYIEKGVLELLPVISSMLELIFESGQIEFAGWIYVLTFGVYSILSTGSDIYEFEPGY